MCRTFNSYRVINLLYTSHKIYATRWWHSPISSLHSWLWVDFSHSVRCCFFCQKLLIFVKAFKRDWQKSWHHLFLSMSVHLRWVYWAEYLLNSLSICVSTGGFLGQLPAADAEIAGSRMKTADNFRSPNGVQKLNPGGSLMVSPPQARLFSLRLLVYGVYALWWLLLMLLLMMMILLMLLLLEQIFKVINTTLISTSAEFHFIYVST